MQEKKAKICCRQHEKAEVEKWIKAYPETIGKVLNGFLKAGQDVWVKVIYYKTDKIHKPILRCEGNRRFTLLVNY